MTASWIETLQDGNWPVPTSRTPIVDGSPRNAGNVLADTFSGVACFHMGDLVVDYSGQLVISSAERHHAGVHPDLAVRQGEGLSI